MSAKAAPNRVRSWTLKHNRLIGILIVINLILPFALVTQQVAEAKPQANNGVVFYPFVRTANTLEHQEITINAGQEFEVGVEVFSKNGGTVGVEIPYTPPYYKPQKYTFLSGHSSCSTGSWYHYTTGPYYSGSISCWVGPETAKATIWAKFKANEYAVNEWAINVTYDGVTYTSSVVRVIVARPTQTPTRTPTPTTTKTSTTTSTPSATSTTTATSTPTPTITATQTATSTNTPTVTPSPTPTVTSVPENTATPIPSRYTMGVSPGIVLSGNEVTVHIERQSSGGVATEYTVVLPEGVSYQDKLCGVAECVYQGTFPATAWPSVAWQHFKVTAVAPGRKVFWIDFWENGRGVYVGSITLEVLTPPNTATPTRTATPTPITTTATPTSAATPTTPTSTPTHSLPIEPEEPQITTGWKIMFPLVIH